MIQRRKLHPGFTFVEVLIAVTLVVVMSLAALAAFRIVERGKFGSTKSSLQTLKLAIELFKEDTGVYPSRLEDLVTRPSDEKIAKKWLHPYIDKEPMDGWKREFEYRTTKGGKHPYELFSWGPNGADSPQEEWLSVWDI